jgi:hypothetical protein
VSRAGPITNTVCGGNKYFVTGIWNRYESGTVPSIPIIEKYWFVPPLLDIPLRLKKKVGGGCALPGADMQKPYASKYGQGEI